MRVPMFKVLKASVKVFSKGSDHPLPQPVFLSLPQAKLAKAGIIAFKILTGRNVAVCGSNLHFFDYWLG